MVGKSLRKGEVETSKKAPTHEVKKVGKIDISEIYGTLKDILVGRAKTPIILKDDRRGETLAVYEVGRARVRIGIDEGEGIYYVNEPLLSPREELLYAYTLQKLMYELKPEEAVTDTIDLKLLEAEKALGLAGKVNIDNIKYYLNREIFGFGPIDVMIRDERVEDIKCSGIDREVIVIHREYGRLGWLKTNLKFDDEDYLADFVRRLAHKGGRGISTAIPYVDCPLTGIKDEKGREIFIRFAGTIGREITRYGSTFVIRKFPAEPFSLAQLVRSGMLSSLMAAYLWFVAENKRIFFVAGPTGSGKTTLLNAILGVLDPRLSYITIEDVYELHLPAWRWIPMTTRRSWAIVESRYEIKIEDLIAMAMRMRPDYLIVGEVRTAEQLIALLLSATTGHGAMTSIHAQDPESLLVRLLTMKIERSALDLLWGCAITQPVKIEEGLGIKRRVVKIAEFVYNPEQEVTEIATVFTWIPGEDKFMPEDVDELWEVSSRLKILSETLKLDREEIKRNIEEKRLFIEANLDTRFKELSDKSSMLYAGQILERRVKIG